MEAKVDQDDYPSSEKLKVLQDATKMRVRIETIPYQHFYNNITQEGAKAWTTRRDRGGSTHSADSSGQRGTVEAGGSESISWIITRQPGSLFHVGRTFVDVERHPTSHAQPVRSTPTNPLLISIGPTEIS